MDFAVEFAALCGVHRSRMETKVPDKQRGQADFRHHEALFLSDLHLGAFGARSDLVLTFLRHNQAETYVLVGDILDLGNRLFSHWNGSHQAVLNHLRDRRDAGAKLVYVRGNHDPEDAGVPEDLRVPAEAQEEAIYVGGDGRRYLVVHGDLLDSRLFQMHVMTRIGCHLDQGLRMLDALIRRCGFGLPARRRSTIEFLLSWLNWSFYARRSHEARLVALARNGGLDGVICGHFHMADLHDRHGLIYANCGDWMDSFTALAVDNAGNLQLLGGRKEIEAISRPKPETELVLS
jgi:UDP-2,3-diacylglucosamine pyrophosphatase LpxH